MVLYISWYTPRTCPVINNSWHIPLFPLLERRSSTVVCATTKACIETYVTVRFHTAFKPMQTQHGNSYTACGLTTEPLYKSKQCQYSSLWRFRIWCHGYDVIFANMRRTLIDNSSSIYFCRQGYWKWTYRPKPPFPGPRPGKAHDVPRLCSGWWGWGHPSPVLVKQLVLTRSKQSQNRRCPS